MPCWKRYVAVLLAVTPYTSIDYLRDSEGQVIQIDGLWAIFFGNGVLLGRADFLYWTASFNDETDGGFGSLNYVGTPNPDPPPAATVAP
jgi:hypothetical protein